jgi:DNA-directed RNA polymerase-5 subunit 1
VALEGSHNPRTDPTDDTELLRKELDLTPASPAAAPQEAPEPDPTDDTGLLGKEAKPDLTPSSPGEAMQATADPDSTRTDI